MDINLLDKDSIKIKIKRVTFAIDPRAKMPKTSADAIVTFDKQTSDETRITDSRVLITGPGEYEVGGVKVVGIKNGNDLCFSFLSGSVSVVVGKVSSLEKILDKISEHNIAILNVDSKLNPSIITTIEPSYLVLYGEQVENELASLSKEILEKKAGSSQKVSINEEKMPEEMELFVLK